LDKYKALITDLDGTLVKTNINWDYLREKIRKILKTNHPLKPLGYGIYLLTEGDPELRKKAFRIVEEAEMKAAENVVFDRKLYETLVRIRSKNVKIGLVTFQSMKTASLILEKLRLTSFFEAVVTRDISFNREEQLKIAMDKLGVKPVETVFVGDSIWDYEAGLKLGCLTVIINESLDNLLCNKIRSFYEIIKYF